VQALRQHANVFPGFFKRVVLLVDGPAGGGSGGSSDAAGAGAGAPPRVLTASQRRDFVLFFINCFQSLEEAMVRDCVLQLVSMELWSALSPGRRFLEFKAVPELRRHWKYVEAKQTLREAAGRLAAVVAATGDQKARALHQSVTTWVVAHKLASKDLNHVLAEVAAMHRRIEAAVAAATAAGSAKAGSAIAGAEVKKQAESVDAPAAAAVAAAAATGASDTAETPAAAPLDFTVHAPTFLPKMLDEFFATLAAFKLSDSSSSAGGGGGDGDGGGDDGGEGGATAAAATSSRARRTQQLYLERFVEFVVDLLSQLPTRRFVRPVLEDRYFVQRCLAAPLLGTPEGALLRKLVDAAHFFQRFEIADQTGVALSEAEVTARHYARMYHLQRMAHKYFKAPLKKFYLASIGSVSSKDELLKHFAVLSLPQLRQLFARLKMPMPPLHGLPDTSDHAVKAFMLDCVASEYELQKSQVRACAAADAADAGADADAANGDAADAASDGVVRRRRRSSSFVVVRRRHRPPPAAPQLPGARDQRLCAVSVGSTAVGQRPNSAGRVQRLQRAGHAKAEPAVLDGVRLPPAQLQTLPPRVRLPGMCGWVNESEMNDEVPKSDLLIRLQ
jgi:hypothetical protein